jgi:transposase
MERGKARVLRPDRTQLQWDMVDLEGLLGDDHRARLVWAFVEQLDLSPFYEAIGAREGEAGRPAADPAVLLALWLYATIDGVGSGRELERLCRSDVAYRWLCGGVPVNYHGLSDFRVGHGAELDRLLTQSVAALMGEGLVDLEEITIDGTKVRASAGKGSFMGSAKLAQAERAAGERVAQLKGELDGDRSASMRRKRAASARAAREIAERAAKARAALDRLAAEKAKRAETHPKDEKAKGEPRVSLTDPEARFMHFADGALRPGYNMQLASVKGLVLAITASDRRNDAGLAAPMVDDLERRYRRAPSRILVDTHYATADDVAALAARAGGGVRVYAPPPAERENVKAETLRRRRAARAKEPPAVEEWRRRMATAGAAAVYRRRKRIELVNAHLKNRGFGVLGVRGILKATAVALWHALAHNIVAIHRLRAAHA